MTAAEMAKYIGKRATVSGSGTTKFEVEIVDVKERWGILRFLVTPVAGSGESWVEHVNMMNERITTEEILERR